MKIKIIIADDHAVIRDGLRLLLRSQQDFAVVGDAVHGREAIVKSELLRPDLIIMDIAMPELNGIEATRQIKIDHPEIRVLILSMYSTAEHIYQAFEAGAQGYLLKETAGAEIITAIRAVYSGKKYLCKKIPAHVLAEYYRLRSTAEKSNPLDRLSTREREILQLVAEGKPSIEIAHLLSLSPKTVETYRSRIMEKLGLENLAGIIKFAIQHGLIGLE